MTRYKFTKAMRILDHAIEHLGETQSCALMIVDGIVSNFPATESVADGARAILANAMCVLVREGGQ